MPVPESFVFTLIQVEGTANLLVNPAFLPKDAKDFYYTATQEVTKRIIVNEQDLRGMGLNETVRAYNNRISSSRYTASTPASTSSKQTD